MVTANQIFKNVPEFVRWTSRTVAMLLIILVITVFIGEGVPNPAILTARELTLMVAMLSILAGLVLGFFREGWGGLLALAGYGVFWVLNDMRELNVLNAAGMVGAAYVFCWWCERWIKNE